MRRLGLQIERRCGRGEVGREFALMHIDADADHCVGQPFGVGSCLNQNAAGFARADQEIVGPAQVDMRGR